MARPRLLTALTLATAFLADGALAQMPPAIAAPDEEIVATFRAEGAQIYECKPGNDGKLAWVFREPDRDPPSRRQDGRPPLRRANLGA